MGRKRKANVIDYDVKIQNFLPHCPKNKLNDHLKAKPEPALIDFTVACFELN